MRKSNTYNYFVVGMRQTCCHLPALNRLARRSHPCTGAYDRSPVTKQAEGAGAPSAIPPLDSQPLSCLRLYGSATRVIVCATASVDAQRWGFWLYAIDTSPKSSSALSRESCSAGSAAG